MNAQTTNEGTESRSLKWVIVPSFIFLLAHLLSTLAPESFWGMDGLVYRPGWFGLGLAAGIVLAAILIRFPPWIERAVGGPEIGIACVALLIVSHLLPGATQLLGDGQLHVRELAGQVWDSHPRMNRAPLTFWSIHFFYSLLSEVQAVDVYAWFSRLSGLVFVLVSGAAARVFVPDRAQVALLLTLLTQGYVQLFLGYVENYSILFPLTAGFLVLCEHARQGRVPVYVPAGILGVMVPMHFTTMAVSPALLWAAWSRGSGGPSDRVIGFLGLGAAPAVSILVLLLIGLGPDSLTESAPGSHLLPLTGQLLQVQPYHLVSWAHLIEVLNQYALVAPAFVVCLGVLFTQFDRRDATDVLLASAALPLVAFTVLFNPAIGSFRDWDAFALPSLPLTILAVRCLTRAYRSTSYSRKAAAVVLLVSAAHTVSWIGVNVNAEATESRFRHLVQEGNISSLARAYGAESLGAHYRDTGRLPQSLAAFEEAARYDPKNGRYDVGRAYALNLLNRKDEAEAALLRALEKTPDRLEAMINLGKLYLETGRPGDAESVLMRALSRNRESTDVIHALGLVAYRQGRYLDARNRLDRASRLEPDNSTYQVDLGTALLALGDLSEAEAILRRVVASDDLALRARMNLGTISYQRGDFTAAEAAFRSVVDRDPGHAGAHLNLGLALLARADSVGAREHLMRSLELEPGAPDGQQIRDLIRQLAGSL